MKIAISLFVLWSSAAFGDEGRDLFDKQCSGCHTIGKGEDGGPDLKGVTAKRSETWLVRVIVEPEKLTAEKDPVHEGLVKKFGYEMPNVGVNRDEAKKIIAYLKQSSGGESKIKAAVIAEKSAPDVAGKDKSVTPVPPEPAGIPVGKPAEVKATPDLIALGRALFTGETKLVKGGAPCASCHPFGYQGVVSGNLAADLSEMYTKMGEQGVRGVLKSLKFPTMKKIYADKPLSDDEITALTAFVREGASRKDMASDGSFLLIGFALLACAIIALSIYKRRIG